jgi:hypothetical protein
MILPHNILDQTSRIAEISYDNSRSIGPGCHQYVVRFKVTMHNIQAMQILDGFKYLTEHNGSLNISQSTAFMFNEREEVASSD